MSSFTDPLEVVQVGAQWRTLRPMHYWARCAEGEAPLAERCAVCHEVPAGFETDFASIPRLFWTLVGHPAGRYAQAAVLHDYLYRTGAVPRREADRTFREAMDVLGVPAWQRWVMWAGVRVGGWAAYNPAPEAA
ncbi:MAG: hypothetical protein RL375_3922 [Pseudomonadota bacterium]|jgi:hypothetical protein